MIKTILIDDELRLLSSLKLMLELYVPQLQVIASCQTPADAIEKIKALNPDLVFLDIGMPGKNAFELLNEIADISFKVIFVTSHSEYSIEAFKYSAIGYLLKPVDENELVATVTKAIKAIHEHHIQKNINTLLQGLNPAKAPQDQKLCLTTLYGFLVVPVSDVIFCAAESAYTNFHLKDSQKVCVSKPLINFDTLLDRNGFMRVHKSYLINLNHVKEYRRGEGGTVIMSNGAEIEVSRRKKELFLEKARQVFML